MDFSTPWQTWHWRQRKIPLNILLQYVQSSCRRGRDSTQSGVVAPAVSLLSLLRGQSWVFSG